MINTLHNEDCLETMKRMPSDYIDLVVTSPPYDGMRKYNGYEFNACAVILELFRIVKRGGCSNLGYW
jgi:site-specific DNA-methyltransferase (adenine-specific)